ncbi:MAG: hypothetical protein AUG51_13820 [Acidobacteria bacterium 13_1_20CM_3_53_8]|nr:MAG: hypothetical protein AUG51_13820 [Acidobacteria bacterium 13_1_20CM_3_53_8]
MYFKVEYNIRDLELDFGDSTASQFVYTHPYKITVTFRQPTAHEQQLGYKKDNLICTVIGQQEPSPEIREMFESLANNKLPAGSKKPDKSNDYIDQAGNINDKYIVPLNLLPQSFQSFSTQVQKELTDCMRNTIRVLRWRYGIRGHHNPIQSVRLPHKWSFDGQTWKSLPSTTTVEIIPVGFLHLTDKVRSEVVTFVEGNITEPLGHELYREAWQQRNENPRSALILAIVAVEVGFKQCVSLLVPDAQWLVENVPSPPIAGMVKNYLPLLPAKLKIKGKVLSPPKEIIRVLQKGVELRNKTIHVGATPPSGEELRELLLAVRDLLYLLDYYSGFDWALDNIRPEIRGILETS